MWFDQNGVTGPAEHGEQDAELVAAHRSAEDASAPGATPVTRPEAEAKPSGAYFTAAASLLGAE